MITVTVIGCGHGGQALAADLTQRGCRVTLYAHPQHPGGIHAIKKNRGINCTGFINEFVSIAGVTTNLQHAIAESEYIFIVLPSYANETIFIEMLPYIRTGQTIITLAANFASLVYLKLLSRMDKTNGIDILDIASLPYVCRADNNGNVEIVTVKNKLAAASIPAIAIEKHIRNLAPIFPCQLIPYQDVLSLGMNVTNGIVHPTVALLNAGRIGKEKEMFYFYCDGITPEIASVIERLDAERMHIGEKLGLEMYSFLTLEEQYYGNRYDSIYQFYRESKVHSKLTGPTSLQGRYVTEDAGGSLVSWYCLGKLVQIESLVLGNLINIASLLNNVNYLRVGTNLVHLNLHDKTIDEVKEYVKTGSLPVGISGMYGDYFNQPKQSFYLGNIA